MRYQPFWCEENIWHLAGQTEFTSSGWVVVISGAQGHVACWGQRAAAPADAAVLWDYHVVFAVPGTPPEAEWQIWDLDCTAGHPLPASVWLDRTFPFQAMTKPAFQPRFACIPAAEYRRDFSTDRSHMRRADGSWQQPPPPWEPPSGTGALTVATAVARARCGLDGDQMSAWLAAHTTSG